MTSPALPARSFEDGKLISIIWSEESVVLGLLHPDGAKFDLAIKGVRALSVHGLRESNSIVDLWVVSGRKPNHQELSGSSLAEVLAALYPGPTRGAKAEVHEDHANFLEGEIQSLVNGEATLVLMGCLPFMDLMALSASVEFRGPL